MSKYAQLTLSASLRNAIKAAIVASPGWDHYRAGKFTMNGQPLTSTQHMTRIELLAACEALNIDAFAIRDALPADADASAPVTPAENGTPAPVTIARDGFEGRNPDDLISEAIGPVAGLLAPSLLEQLRAGVSTLAQAAAQGPRTVVQTVRLASGGDADAADALPTPQVSALKAAREYFGLTASEGGTTWRRVLDENSLHVYDFADAPAVDTNFVWEAETAGAYAAAAIDGTNLFLSGPAGSGKSESARQFAALGRRPFVRIAINRTTEPADLIGQYLPKPGGGHVWKDGPLTRAFRIPGCVVLIDEPSFLRPGSLAVFQTTLDFGAIYLPTGETVNAAPGVFMVAADNTTGSGDETGRYADTSAMNMALIDRFQFMLAVDYLSEAREAKLLSDRAGITLPVARHMAQLAALTRRGCVDGKLTAGLSFRRLHAWALAVKRGVPSKHAFTMCVVTPADPADRETLRQIEATQGGHDRIDAVMSGAATWEQTAPQADPVAVTPQGQHAQNMFADASAL